MRGDFPRFFARRHANSLPGPPNAGTLPGVPSKKEEKRMSKLGTRWEFDGVPAAFVTRSAVNGHYCITFEREVHSSYLLAK